MVAVAVAVAPPPPLCPVAGLSVVVLLVLVVVVMLMLLVGEVAVVGRRDRTVPGKEGRGQKGSQVFQWKVNISCI